MKIPRYLMALAVLASALTLSANACQLVPVGGVGFELNPPTLEESFNALVGNLESGSELPLLAGARRITTGLDAPIDLTGWCYVVVHYGPGDTTLLFGGSDTQAFIEESPGSCDFTFPQTGDLASAPTNGPIMSVSLFKCPENGTTMMLLGSALAGLGFIRRFMLHR